MNKTECLDLLDKVESKVENNKWEAQVDDLTSLLDHEDLKPYLKYFGLPEAELCKGVCVRLPEGWMTGEQPDEDLSEVIERYEEVYHFIRTEASREMEALVWIDEQEETYAHQEYWRLTR